MAKFDFGAYYGAKSAGIEDTAATYVSEAIDTQGFAGTSVITVTDSDFAASSGSVVFYEGDTDKYSDATVVEAHRVITNPAPEAASTVYKARVVPTKRYLFAKYTFGGTPAGKVATIGILGFPGELPVE